ncbi:Ribosomal protein S18 acetylase RimI [Sphingomonas guangdongensis]|uniref:Ribosomal protein S18 acetylase RimI n=1 Tax=Sphingomonas guangdongensis TaxID=1141890 RepID=A0A285QGD9_9SPHN|nr:GNAT family N-acetyltransferase [Sphingomonas guangdongensis]SOB81010.1 Ribosomal protein S18 acetylase RimI [Sphingomonas guangdongensis]
MITYRDAVTQDGPQLAQMARRCFTETFGTLYRQSDLAAFLDQAFGATGLPGQIDDPAFTIRQAFDGDRIVGFAKLGPNALPLPSDAARGHVAELYQLYVTGDQHGAGVGPTLLEWAIATARYGGADTLALSVYVDNHRAKRFYARYGFVDVGRYDFPVGETIDEDRLMVLAL